MIKISDLIQRLNVICEAYGDLECYYASDDEGNSYQRVGYEADLIYLNDDNEIVTPFDEDDAKKYKSVCCIN